MVSRREPISGPLTETILARLNKRSDVRWHIGNADEARSPHQPHIDSVGGNYGSVGLDYRPAYEADPKDLRVRQYIADGEVEKLEKGELRCWVEGKTAHLAYFENGEQASKTLSFSSDKVKPGGRFDVGLFTWFDNLVDIQTAWSDNAPPQCYLLTIEQLRDLVGVTAKTRRRRAEAEELEERSKDFRTMIACSIAYTSKKRRNTPEGVRDDWFLALVSPRERHRYPGLAAARRRHQKRLAQLGRGRLRDELRHRRARQRRPR